MKKITSIAIALLLLVSCFTFAVSAEVATQIVTIEATEDSIEVEPGQTYVPVTWAITKNEGWGAFKFYVEFDGDVMAFSKGGEIGYSDEQGTFAFFIDDARTYRNNIGAVTTNIFGIDQGADPTITKDRSSFLVEGKSNTADVTVTGDFFTAFIDIADNAPAGTYKIKITTDENNCSSILGPTVAKPSITWTEATIVVKGDNNAPVIDERLGVEGAQVRAAAGEVKQGLRFISTIEKDLYDVLKAQNAIPTSAESTGVGFGTVVLPKQMLGDAELTKETANAKIVPAVKLYSAPKGSETAYKFTACLTGLVVEQYVTEYTVRPYVTYEKDGEVVTVYGEQYSTTVFAVAEAAYNSGKETQSVSEYLLNNILSKINPTKYPADSWTGIYKP